MLESINASLEFVVGYNLEGFSSYRNTKSATIRELEIIGDATSRISTVKKDGYSDVPRWLMNDFRNFLYHENFGVNEELIWDIVQKKLPGLNVQIEKIIMSENKTEYAFS